MLLENGFTRNDWRNVLGVTRDTYTLLKLFIIYTGLEPKDYEEKVKSSWIWSDLKKVRNVRPSFHTKFGLFGGMAYSGFTLAVKGKEPWTLSHGSMYTYHYLPTTLLCLFIQLHIFKCILNIC